MSVLDIEGIVAIRSGHKHDPSDRGTTWIDPATFAPSLDRCIRKVELGNAHNPFMREDYPVLRYERAKICLTGEIVTA